MTPSTTWSPSSERAETVDDPASAAAPAGAGRRGDASARSAPSGTAPGRTAPVIGTAGVAGHPRPDGHWSDALGWARSATPACSSRRCRTARGAPRPGAARRTSGSSSWATPCSAWWWPSTATAPIPTCPRAPWPRCGPPWSTPVLAEVAPELDLGAALAPRPGRGRRRGAGPSRRSWPTPSRPSSAPSTSTAGGRRPTGSCSACSTTGSRRPRPGPGAEDFKTRLQELSSAGSGKLPRYEVAGTGPDHARRYTAHGARGRGRVVGEGEGGPRRTPSRPRPTRPGPCSSRTRPIVDGTWPTAAVRSHA